MEDSTNNQTNEPTIKQMNDEAKKLRAKAKLLQAEADLRRAETDLKTAIADQESSQVLDQANLQGAQNTFNETVVQGTKISAEQIKAEVDKKNAKSNQEEASYKRGRSHLKRTLACLGVGSALIGGSIIAYKAAKGVNKAMNEHPQAVESFSKDVTEAALDTLNSAGKTAKSAGRIVRSAGEASETVAERTDQFISRPELNQFLTRIKGTIAFPGVRGNQASDWNTEHPDMPMSKDQLVTILKAQDDFLKKEGRAMTVKEVNKAAQKICGWKKVSQQIQKARQNDGR